jgi:hypothetical protein
MIVWDERYQPCSDATKNSKIYTNTAYEIFANKDYSDKERNERLEMEELLLVYRINKIVPFFMSYEQEARLKELVAKYDDPSKLKRKSIGKVYAFVGKGLIGLGLFKKNIRVFHKQLKTRIDKINDNINNELVMKEEQRDILGKSGNDSKLPLVAQSSLATIHGKSMKDGKLITSKKESGQKESGQKESGQKESGQKESGQKESGQKELRQKELGQ